MRGKRLKQRAWVICRRWMKKKGRPERRMRERGREGDRQEREKERGREREGKEGRELSLLQQVGV